MINQVVYVLMSLMMSVSMTGCSNDLFEKYDNVNNNEEIVS